MAPTLAKRYLFKLLSNLVSVPVYLVMEALLPRALGPQMYGNYSFATNLYQQLSGFLDMGTSTCFYNALSRRQREMTLLAFYLRIAILVGIAMLMAGALALWAPLGAWILPDAPLWLAPLAALWALLTWWSRVLRSANDALGATIPSEIWRSLISLGAVLLLALLFLAGQLNIWTLFLQQYLLLAATAMAFWLVSKRRWQAEGMQLSFALAPEQNKRLRAEFLAYSHPLLAQALLSFFMLSAERWLLQWFNGSAQQGFYALSQKVSMACFLFVSAMTPLLMREFSVAWGAGDRDAMGALLARMAPGLYLVAAYFSCFTVAEARPLVEIFGGGEFLAAALPVQIMALYPLHQTYGQIAGSVFHATGKTHVLRNMTACECVFGLAFAWLLLAPPRLYGLDLGATGLAVKTVATQAISVNVCLWLASRMIPFNFWRNIGHQLAALAILLCLAFAARQITLQLAFLDGHFLWRFLASGFIYTCAVAASAIISPRLLGLSRKDAGELIRRLRDFRRI